MHQSAPGKPETGGLLRCPCLLGHLPGITASSSSVVPLSPTLLSQQRHGRQVREAWHSRAPGEGVQEERPHGFPGGFVCRNPPRTEAIPEREEPPGRMAPRRDRWAVPEGKPGREETGGAANPGLTISLPGCRPARSPPTRKHSRTRSTSSASWDHPPSKTHWDPGRFFKRFLAPSWRLLYQGEPPGGDHSSEDGGGVR